MVGMSLSMGQSLQQTQRQSLEQRLALALKQKLELKMSLAQVIKLVQKLWPQLTVKMSQQVERYLGSSLRHDPILRRELPRYLETEPTAVQLQREFPQLAPVFNAYYQTQPNYGTALRRQAVVVPTQRSEIGLSLRMTHSIKQTISLPPTNWSLVDAYKAEEDKGCKLPKKQIEGLDHLPLESRLKQVDAANEIFRFAYTQEGKKYYKVPLLRNRNVEIDDIAVKITKAEYTLAIEVLEKAGAVQRIVRAVPYSEIRESILDHLAEKEVDLDNVVLVGIDRGGRLPTHIVRTALGKSQAYFLKVNQGNHDLDEVRLQTFIDHKTLKGKYVVFIDSTVDSGRQIRALKKYFEDDDFKKAIGHEGWVVIGSNDTAESLDDHVNIDWGLDPDQSFEDNPQLMGVDYAEKYTKVKACGNRMSTDLRNMLLEVPKGIFLDYGQQTPAPQAKKQPAAETPAYTVTGNIVHGGIVEFGKEPKRLVIVGDGKQQTVTDQDARNLALKIEHGFHVVAGTPNGNPGYILELVSQYPQKQGTTLVQPKYQEGQTPQNGFDVVYEGATKGEFRDALVSKGDVVLALPGNEGTWEDIQRALASKKPTIVVKEGFAGKQATAVTDPNLHLVANLEDAINALHQYR